MQHRGNTKNPYRSLWAQVEISALSVTDHCNYRCQYCMPAGGLAKLTHGEVLKLEEMARVAKAAVGLGVEKIRLTGGEPLMRRNISVLLESLNQLSPRPELAITTNGFLLEQNLDLLARTRVKTINVSLDSLKPERYAKIIGLGSPRGEEAFKRVWQGIMAALKRGVFTVKVNQVVLRGVNDDEILDFARLGYEHELVVRFIEYMPVGRDKEFDAGQFMPADEVYNALKELGPMQELSSKANDGPARRLKPTGALGELGIISALSAHFCGTCNRLRLSADGSLVPCLFSEASVDLRKILRNGAKEPELVQALLKVRPKAFRASRRAQGPCPDGLPMSRLGG